MPTTASSNNPHVRITPNTHDKVRLLSFVLRISQGDLIELLASEKLAELGNPNIYIAPRQSRKAEQIAVTNRGVSRRRSNAGTVLPAKPVPVEKPPGRRRSKTAA